MERAAALQRAALAHVVDDQAAHRARRVGEEAALVGKRGASIGRGEIQIGLVQQCGGTEREARPAAAQLVRREPVQLAVQLLEQHLRLGWRRRARDDMLVGARRNHRRLLESVVDDRGGDCGLALESAER
jgi:hypothetical protein